MGQINLPIMLWLYGSFALPGFFIVGAYVLLPGGKHSLKTLATLLAVACISGILWLVGDLTTWESAILAAPLLQFAGMAAAYRLFIRLRGRPPVDVAFNWEPGLVADRVYAVIVTLAPLFVVAAAFAPWMPRSVG